MIGAGKHALATARRTGPAAAADHFVRNRRPGGEPIPPQTANGPPFPRVSVVIPVLNEAPNMPLVLPRVPEWVHEVMIVDGRSTDDTVAVSRRVRPDIRVVEEIRPGKGVAARSGFAGCTGDVIVMLDGDGSTDPAEIPAYVGALLAGADLAKGSRFVRGGGTADMSRLRRLGNWGFVILSRALFGSGYSDLCYGYTAFWARVLPELDLDGDGFEIETVLFLRALCRGLRVTEVASFEHERAHGKSNLRVIPDGWRVLRTIGREWLRERFRPWLRGGLAAPARGAPEP